MRRVFPGDRQRGDDFRGRVRVGSQARSPLRKGVQDSAPDDAGHDGCLQRAEHQERDELLEKLFCADLSAAGELDEPVLPAAADPVRVPYQLLNTEDTKDTKNERHPFVSFVLTQLREEAVRYFSAWYIAARKARSTALVRKKLSKARPRNGSPAVISSLNRVT